MGGRPSAVTFYERNTAIISN